MPAARGKFVAMSEQVWEMPEKKPPAGLDVHVEQEAGQLCLWIDAPPRRALMREGFLPPILILLFTSGMGILGLRFAASPSLGQAIVLGVGIWFWVRALRDLKQNAGIVTRVEVRDGSFLWAKSTLWGKSEHRWPIASITQVRVKNWMLKVERRPGFPLGAFSYRRHDQLVWLADLLQAAVSEAQAREGG